MTVANALTVGDRLLATSRFDAAIALVNAINHVNLAGYVGLGTDNQRRELRAAEGVWDVLNRKPGRRRS